MSTREVLWAEKFSQIFKFELDAYITFLEEINVKHSFLRV